MASRNTQLSQKQDGDYKHVEIKEVFNPFPDGNQLEQLNKLGPEYLERVFNYFEKEQDHRHSINKEEQKEVWTYRMRQDRKFFRGQIFAFILIILLMGLGTTLLFYDKNLAGLSIIFSGVIAAALGFIGKFKKTETTT